MHIYIYGLKKIPPDHRPDFFSNCIFVMSGSLLPLLPLLPPPPPPPPLKQENQEHQTRHKHTVLSLI